ncbi:MAG: hypothetical protein AAB554_02380 [Patescibacteria group bacterium]
MPKKQSSGNLFQYVLMSAVALFRWGVKRLWNILTFWQAERKKPLADRQKVDRQKAVAGLLAVVIAVGGVAFFVWKGLIAVFSMSVAFLDRQMALYIGAALLIVGLNILRLMPQRKKIGLVLMALGALLVAYGLGYLG